MQLYDTWPVEHNYILDDAYQRPLHTVPLSINAQCYVTPLVLAARLVHKPLKASLHH